MNRFVLSWVISHLCCQGLLLSCFCDCVTPRELQMALLTPVGLWQNPDWVYWCVSIVTACLERTEHFLSPYKKHIWWLFYDYISLICKQMKQCVRISLWADTPCSTASCQALPQQMWDATSAELCCEPRYWQMQYLLFLNGSCLEEM